MSTSAAGHLPPAFPERAAWGTAAKLRAWQEEALEAYLGSGPRDFLAVATPGAGKTTYALRIATELLDRGVVRRRHRRRPHRAPQAPVGRRRRPGRHPAQPGVLQLQRPAQSHEYDGVALTYAAGRLQAALHRGRTEDTPTLVILDEIHHGGDARSWGDGIREAFERRHPPAVAHRHAVPLGHHPRSRSCATRWTRTASCARRPTTATATPRRCATGSCARCSSWPTAARCAGAPRPATRSPPGSASR